MDRETPLHRAALNDSAKVVELLIAHGADIEAKDKNGRTPERMAEQAGHVAVADYLKSVRLARDIQADLVLMADSEDAPAAPGCI